MFCVVLQVLPVTVPKKTFSDYYNGCCNATFWPLFHSMPDRATFEADKWEVGCCSEERVLTGKRLRVLNPL